MSRMVSRHKPKEPRYTPQVCGRNSVGEKYLTAITTVLRRTARRVFKRGDTVDGACEAALAVPWLKPIPPLTTLHLS